MPEGNQGEAEPSQLSELLGNWGRDLTQVAKEGRLDPVIGREIETGRVMQVLSRRTRNNPVLVSEPGIGTSSIVDNLAQKIVTAEAPERLRGRTLWSLDLSVMKTSLVSRGSFEEKLKLIFTKASSHYDLILYIDGLYLLLGDAGSQDETSAALVFKSMVERGLFQVVGATLLDEYERYLEKDIVLQRMFQSIEISEMTVGHTIEYLKGMRDRYEAHHRISITDDALVASAELADRYIRDRFLPEKALDLIEEAGSRFRVGWVTDPPVLREYRQKIAQIRKEKGAAIDSMDFEMAAEFRDAEKQMLAKMAVREKEWKAGDIDIVAEINEQLIAEVVSSRTGVPVRRILDRKADAGPHFKKAENSVSNSERNYALLNDGPMDNFDLDLLGTRAAAGTIADLLIASREATPFVLAVDGGWGIGKSTMLRQIENCLADENDIVCVHFNAWTARGESALEGLIKSVLGRLDPNILRRSIRRLAEQRGIIGIARILTLVAARFFGATRLVDELWSRLAVDAKSRNEMKDIIGNMLLQWTQNSGQPNRALVVFIDDLDRCSDEAIIQVCEAVKLYLDAPGMIFVLACDLSVLARGAATSARGGEGEGRAYLEKIVQVAYKVPPPDDAKLERLIHGFGEKSGTAALLDEVVTQILLQRAGRNPRKIKRIINSFVLEYRLNPAWQVLPLDSSLLVIAILIQHLYPSFYEYLISGDVGDDPIGMFLDYVSVRTRASNPPAPDNAWWAVVQRVFREHEISPPDRSLEITKLADYLTQLEKLFPESFPKLARSEDFSALLRSIGDKDSRRALRAQLISRPLGTGAVVDGEELLVDQNHT